MRADRLLTIVGLLRRHGRLSAADLARRLEVDPRTVMRDMEALSASGVPVYAERGRHGGYALLPGYAPDPAELTPEEARALFVAGGARMADALGIGGPLTSALGKLATGLPASHHDHVSRAVERIVVDAASWTGTPEPLPHLGIAQEAVFADRRVVLDYVPRENRRPGQRTVDPYGLLLAGPTWYLLAGHRGRPRSYRVSRIQGLRVLDAPARRPPDLDLRALWETMRASYADRPGLPVDLRLRRARVPFVLRLVAPALVGRPDLPDPGDPEEEVVLRVRLASETAAVALLLGMADEAEILGPPHLRVRVAAAGATLARRYGRQADPAAAR